MAGVTVSIAAFQAVDPGSIPGPRKFLQLDHSWVGSVGRAWSHNPKVVSSILTPGTFGDLAARKSRDIEIGSPLCGHSFLSTVPFP